MVSGINILDFPAELAEQVFLCMGPVDLAQLAQTCKAMHQIVSDMVIWRRLFQLWPFDDLREALQIFGEPEMSPNWKHVLQSRIKAERIAYKPGLKEVDHRFALETFISVVQTALPHSEDQPWRISHNLTWLTDLLSRTKILGIATQSKDSIIASLAAQLRTSLTLSLENHPDTVASRTRLQSIRTKSRCYVYDLRNYRRDNNYGPFTRDGYVNWIHVESIVNVIALNISEPEWSQRPPMYLQATRPYSAPGTSCRAPFDWAGVEGKWKRYVCFMDYRDLFAFNYSSMTHGPRDPAFFEDVTFHEATRLIDIELKLIPPPENGPSSSSLSDATAGRFPELFFSGMSSGLPGTSVTVSGSASMASDGIVRWRMATTYDGHTQWSSESVQIGNVASAAGAVGSWTGAGHDTADPVGPCWMWKISG